MSERKYIGRFGVDSGQVMIVDPCYLADWKNNEYDRKEKGKSDFSYNGACHATLSEEKAGVLKSKVCPALAVVSCTGWGDGVYPVYATYNTEGRIMKLEIEFGEVD